MLLLEFAFLCGEDNKSLLNHRFYSHLSAEWWRSVFLQNWRHIALVFHQAGIASLNALITY